MFRKKKDPLREVDAILLDHENRIAALVANAALLERDKCRKIASLPRMKLGSRNAHRHPLSFQPGMRWWHERANSLRKRSSLDSLPDTVRL